MAATGSLSSRTRRASRAAIVPIVTLSWLWHSVVRLNTLAGMVSFSASAVSAEAAICIALKPWWAARSGVGARHQVRGQAVARPGVAEQRELAVEEVGDVRDGGLEPVHRERDVAAVEVAAVEDVAGVGVDERVVVRAVDLDLERAPHGGQRVEQHADHVRRAADRVAVLDAPRGAAARGVVLEVRADPARAQRLSRVRLRREDARVEVRRPRRAGRRSPSR